MSDNVIKFPGVVEISQTKDDVMLELEQARIAKAEEIADEILEMSVTYMKNYGYFTNMSKIHVKDVVFISEALKAAMLRYNGIEDKLHPIIDTYLQVEGIDYPIEPVE